MTRSELEASLEATFLDKMVVVRPDLEYEVYGRACMIAVWDKQLIVQVQRADGYRSRYELPLEFYNEYIQLTDGNSTGRNDGDVFADI